MADDSGIKGEGRDERRQQRPPAAPPQGSQARHGTAQEVLELSQRFLDITIRQAETAPLLGEAVAELRKFTGCAAVGIRLLDEEGNIPYQAYEGFSRNFYELESPLSVDTDRCMCINVIKQQTDPALPFYTRGGSFYMNATTRFLATVSEQEKGETRNACNEHGYESVALVPIPSAGGVYGLIHVADPREEMVPLEVVEALEAAADHLGAAIRWVRGQDALRRSERELSRARDELERRVEERTAALQQSEERFRRLSEATVEAIVFHDQGIILDANQAFAKMFGYELPEVIGMNAVDLAVPESRPLMRTNSLSRNEGPYEAVGLRKDGSTFVGELIGRAIPYGGKLARVTVIRDITERRRAEQAMAASEASYRAVFDNANDMIVIHDSGTGRPLDINRKVIETFGWSKEEYLRLKIEDWSYGKPPYGQEEAVERVQKAAAGEPQIFEWLCRKKNGELFWVEVSLKQAALGGRDCVLAVVRDISERKRAEEQIKASLREKEVLLNEIHHRVKNNLQIISSLLNLQAGFTTDRRALELFAESRNRVRAMGLIHEKLYQSGDLARVEFGDYLRALTATLFRSYGADPHAIRLSIEAPGISLGLEAAIPCALIVNELVSNCLKHAFVGGRRGELRIGLRSERDEEFTLVVGDNGVGFPQGLDFRNTATLGLQLVTTLTDQLRGTIELNPRSGTEFAIRFSE